MDTENNWDNLDSRSSDLQRKQRYEKRAARALKDTPYYSVSPVTLGILSFISFGYYDIYWSYRNWKLIKVVHGEKILPFWRAWFNILFIEMLFERITDSAETKGYKTRQSTWLLTGIYIFACIGISVISRYSNFESTNINLLFFGLLIIRPLALIPIQIAINYNNSKLPVTMQTMGKI